MPNILICDDQDVIHDTLGAYLRAEGYTPLSAMDGEEALARLASEPVDLVVLDLMMPKLSGIEVCREVRKTSDVPIIMLTAKGEEIDRILGLELGADDYIVKPFSPREVVARIKAVLRRYNAADHQDGEEVLSFGELTILPSRYEVRYNGELLTFTPKEVEVLHMLAKSPGQVFTREQILNEVWGYDFFGDTRVVDTQIKRIRQKMSDCSQCAIRSIYGVGYKFEIQHV